MPQTWTFVKAGGAPAGAIHVSTSFGSYLIDDGSNTTIVVSTTNEANELKLSPTLTLQGVAGTYTPSPSIQAIELSNGKLSKPDGSGHIIPFDGSEFPATAGVGSRLRQPFTESVAWGQSLQAGLLATVNHGFSQRLAALHQVAHTSNAVGGAVACLGANRNAGNGPRVFTDIVPGAGGTARSNYSRPFYPLSPGHQTLWNAYFGYNAVCSMAAGSAITPAEIMGTRLVISRALAAFIWETPNTGYPYPVGASGSGYGSWVGGVAFPGLAPAAGAITSTAVGDYGFMPLVTSSGDPLPPGMVVTVAGLVTAGDTGIIKFSDLTAGTSFKTLDLSTVAPPKNVALITVNGAPTGGTFTLTWGGQTTAAITYAGISSTTAGNMTAALNALSGINGAAWVTNDSVGFMLTLSTGLVGANAGTLTATTGGLTGGTTPSLTIAPLTVPWVQRLVVGTDITPAYPANQLKIAATSLGAGVSLKLTSSWFETPLRQTVIVPNVVRPYSNNPSGYSSVAARDTAITNYNTALQAMCQEFAPLHDVIYVDLDSAFNKQRAYFSTVDDLHWTDSGHALATQTCELARLNQEAAAVDLSTVVSAV